MTQIITIRGRTWRIGRGKQTIFLQSKRRVIIDKRLTSEKLKAEVLGQISQAFAYEDQIDGESVADISVFTQSRFPEIHRLTNLVIERL